MEQLRVGFVGVGDLGMPVATRIAQQGWPLSVWARRPQVLAPLEAMGTTSVMELDELGRACDVVGILVTDTIDVIEVLEAGLLAGMRSGAVVMIHSTVPPAACHRFATLAERVGVHVVDAPLCGGARAAAVGQLLIPVGGDDESFIRCRPLLECIGGFVRHVGPLGTGERCKLLYNLLYTASVEIVTNALMLGERSGLDRAVLGEMFSSLPYIGYVGNALATGRGGAAAVEHGWSLLSKDVSYALEMLEEAGVEPGLLGQLGKSGLGSLISQLQ